MFKTKKEAIKNLKAGMTFMDKRFNPFRNDTEVVQEAKHQALPFWPALNFTLAWEKFEQVEVK